MKVNGFYHKINKNAHIFSIETHYLYLKNSFQFLTEFYDQIPGYAMWDLPKCTCPKGQIGICYIYHFKNLPANSLTPILRKNHIILMS